MPYPFSQPGATFGPSALFDAVVPKDGPRFALEYVRLADPAAAPAIADRLQASAGERRGDRRRSLAAAARGRR